MLQALSSHLHHSITPTSSVVATSAAPTAAAAAPPPPPVFVVAQMSHETNTFSPVVTDLARFAGGLPGSGLVPPSGQTVIRRHRGQRTGLGAFIELAETAAGGRGEVVASIDASAPPSGVVQDHAYDYICDAICTTVREMQPDAIFLCLHGAMVCESYDDGEGELLRRLRALPCVAKAQTPIAVTFDMHCNFHEQGLLADTIAGYQTYPHEDQYETAVRAGSALLRMMEGACKPTIAWAPRPMLPHVMRQSSLEPYSVPERTFKTPNRAIQARCREMESTGEALCASFFVGFPHADIRMAGVAAVVVTDGNAALAERLRDELLEMAWAARADFVYEPEPLASAIDRARAMAAVPLAEGEARKPVILLDHCDNCASGGTMDTTCVLRAVLAAQLTDVCFFGIFDPAAAQTLIDAGAGACVQLELGGKLPMPAIGEEVGVPLPVTGVVVAAFAEMEAAVLRVGAGGGVDGVDICVVSRHVEPSNLEVIRRLGIEPTEKRFLVLKSRVHWQNSLGFGPIYRGVVECDGAGVCGSDYSVLTFENVRRPIFPLDSM